MELEQFLNEGAEPLLVALSPRCRRDSSLSGLIKRLEINDPRFVQTISVISLFEQQQERLPPALLADSGLSCEELPWAAPFSVQAQAQAFGRSAGGYHPAAAYGPLCWSGGLVDLA